ncbi:nickel-binding protein [Pricia sp.]|uniref:nickel-binding protein n=1 Tax=Pricia sp. TaxID=2268138 RepID=UPI003593A5FE
MPIFMDCHIVPGIEAQNAAEAHREDLRIQDKFGCRCMTYWVDEERGSAFCLVDGPDEVSVKKMHDMAHGLIPHEIIQVNSNVVEAFLGRIHDPEGYYGVDPDLKIFNDPAFRIIMVSGTKDTRLQKKALGREKAAKLMALYHEMMRSALQEYEGREVELEGEGFIASFVSVTQAVRCALALQKGLHVAGELIDLRIGLNAGMPVSKSKSLFGNTIEMAKYLSGIGPGNQIAIASIVREIYKEDGQNTVNGKNLFKWIGPTDESFLGLLMNTMAANWQNPDVKVGDFCRQMSMSKSKLFRRSTEITGMSPNNLLREYRLLRSLDLLKTDRNIFQTAFDAGFTSPSYFTKCFQKRFDIQPLSYQKEQ